MLFSLAVVASCAAGWAAASPGPRGLGRLESDLTDALVRRQGGSTTTSSAASSACTGNTATTRAEWCDYSLDTDYYLEAPDTGVTREFWVSRQILPSAFSLLALSSFLN